ncbi:MAG TPA: rhodanese-like domain-containing protein [Dehalococcoidia bacterium]|nr:rhodanese-like domain-containing protein [Dehalococcoidia bacterium]
MRIKDWLRILLVFSVVLLLFTMPMLTACGGGDGEQEEEEEEEEEEEASEFEIIMEAIEDYLADKAGNMSASDLHVRIAEDDAPYIVSIRSAADYAAGHIPGAVNMTFGQLTTLSDDEEILVYCYTGQSGSFAAAMLGVLEYDVTNLLHGMCAWSTDPAVTGTGCFNASRDQGDYAVETTANTVTTSYDYPELDNTTSSDEDTIIEAAAATVSPSYITAADLNLKIAEEEDMTIISCRSAADYAAGHIPGAINIGIDSLLDNLDKIDPDAPVYVYCYTGHTAGQAAALLQMLGYDAYSLKFGMCSWTSDPAVHMNKCFNASTVTGYDVE